MNHFQPQETKISPNVIVMYSFIVGYIDFGMKFVGIFANLIYEYFLSYKSTKK